MMRIISKFKDVLRPFVATIRKRRLIQKLAMGARTKNSGYAFHRNDIELYVSELNAQLSTKVVNDCEDKSLCTVKIDGREIYWPSALGTEDLPWLYHEIFDPFKENPSSYNNPRINYEGRNWVIDAGAAEGYFSIFSIEASQGKIFCIEPLSVMRNALVRTLALYAKDERFNVISAALSSQSGWSEIQINAGHICDSKIVLTSPSANEMSIAPPLTEKVPVTTIDQLVAQYALGEGGVIKMDIEGLEMAALMGAVGAMKKYKPALAIAVYHDLENAKKCAEIIKAANSSYEIEYRGYYGYFDPPRPYMVFAY